MSWTVDYEFQVDTGHSKTVVNGFLRRQEEEINDIAIPTDLHEVILIFYGLDAYKTRIRGSHEISFGLYCSLHYGSAIEITYDSRFPRRRHIPTLEYEYRGKCYWVRYFVGALVMIMLYMILSSVNCKVSAGRTQFVWILVLFGIYSAGIVTCCGLLRSAILLLYFALTWCCPDETPPAIVSTAYLQADTSSDSVESPWAAQYLNLFPCAQPSQHRRLPATPDTSNGLKEEDYGAMVRGKMFQMVFVRPLHFSWSHCF